jgi:gamma-glutamyltranspeptidase/glutathione hydrolase
MRSRSIVAALLSLALACQGKTAPAPAASSADAGAAAHLEADARSGDSGKPDVWKDDQPPAFPDVPVAEGAHGMVVSEGALATQAGVDVLQGGGNAVDAAVATAFALAVVHPAAGNIGGGGFALVRQADGKVVALDFRETAPGAASRDMYANKGKNGSLDGALASGVPGSVAGLWALHKKYGSRPWKELIAPSVKLARDGFVVDDMFVKELTHEKDRLAKYPASAALFLPGGAPPAVGSTWKAPELADTLERIGDNGLEEFYSGKTADLIVAEMKNGGGIITKADLAGYKVAWREPIRFEYRGYVGYSMPPPSSGGIALAMTANIVSGFDLKQMGWHSADAMHVVIEAWRRAYAARNLYLGDPAYVKDMPLAKMLAPTHAEALRKSIVMDKASSSEVTPELLEGVHTTHFAVVDAKGMTVSLTTTINLGFGSAVTVAGAGFLLNDEMDDFATKPGQPNAYGLVQGEANKIEPGKRMLSSMSPTIVVDAKGQPFLVVGAQGGSMIITAVFQVMSNVIDYDMDVGKAVGARRFHHQHLPNVVMVEAGAVEKGVFEALGARGHTLKWAPRGLATAPAILRRGDTWTGAVDPRKGGLAKGY